MRRFLRSFVVGTLALVLLPQGVIAQSASTHTNPGGADSEIQGQVASSTFLPTHGTTNLILELEGQPSVTAKLDAVRKGLTRAGAASVEQSQVARNLQQQHKLDRTLSEAKATVLYRLQRIYNGIAIRVDAEKIPSLVALPGVKAIHPLKTYQRDNSISVPFIGAPQLWNLNGVAYTGKGMRVGVIDTGIDYTHANLAGTKNFSANDGKVIEPGSFPTPKVFGGTDLAGDDYNADPSSDLYQPVPHPDADPLDCASDLGGGHGSHVSGTIAGYGVNPDGTTYGQNPDGTVNNSAYGPSIDYSALKIGPGVAPEATLFGIRVFGCHGSTDLVPEAFEYAVDPNQDGDTSDRLDVVNLSLGSTFGGEDDTSSVMAENATKAGVVVVASAGNSGDTYYISGSPATADGVISVASTLDPGMGVLSAIVVNSPDAIKGLKMASDASFGPDLEFAGDVSGDVLYPATNATGCNAFPASTFTGKIALIDRGTCTFKAKTSNAEKAGAIGVLIVNNRPAAPTPMGDDEEVPAVTIPAMMTTQVAGTEIKGQLSAGNTVNVTLTAKYRDQFPIVDASLADTLSSFSSRGPRKDGLLKPDIAAPGDSIFSTKAGSNTEGESMNGTSMAAPHIAGSMALLRQIHPTWSVAELKALAMNTAIKDVRSEASLTSPRYGPARVGAGRIDLPNAAKQQVLLFDSERPENVSVSFGWLEVTGNTTITRTVDIVNKGSESKSYALSYDEVTAVPGVSYTVSPSSLTLAAGKTAQATVTIHVDYATLADQKDPTVAAAQTLPRHFISEASGYLALAESGSLAARVPVHAGLRRASAAHAASSVLPALEGVSSPSGEIKLAGDGLNDKRGKSVVGAFELQATSPVTISADSYAAAADVQYVGVMSDFTATITDTAPTGVVSDTTAYFAVSSYRGWASPNELRVRIDIDTDQNGTTDYQVLSYNYDQVVLGADYPSDVLISVICAVKTESCTVADYLNGVSATSLNTNLLNSRVMVLPVPLSMIGKSGATDSHPRFNYSITTSYDSTLLDHVNGLSYDPTKPGLDTTAATAGVPFWVDGVGNSIPMAYNAENYQANGSKGLLLLHLSNPRETQAEVLTFGKLFLPLVAR